MLSIGLSSKQFRTFCWNRQYLSALYKLRRKKKSLRQPRGCLHIMHLHQLNHPCKSILVTSESCGSIALTSASDILASPQLLLHEYFSCEPLYTVMFVTQNCGNKAHLVGHTLCELQLRSCCCCNPLAWTPP